MKFEWDLSNCATKAELKNPASVDTSNFAKNLIKSNIGKLDVDKLKNVPTCLNSLKSKVDKLCVV